MNPKFGEFNKIREFDKDPLCCLYLIGTVVATCFLTQEETGSNNLAKTKYFCN